MNSERLELISLSDDLINEFYLISMDGSEDRCNPDILLRTFPDLFHSYIIITAADLKEEKNKFGFFSKFKAVESIVRLKIGNNDFCIVDDIELRVFTKSKKLKDKLLDLAKQCLPEL